MNLSKQEQETIITFNRGELMANIYTSDPVWIRKMDKLVKANPDEFHGDAVNSYSMNYTLPKKLISIRSRTRVIELTQEEKESMAAHARKTFWAKGDQSENRGSAYEQVE